jgi:16S rRNA (cytidine1402-2'-O)-methyltransferase
VIAPNEPAEAAELEADALIDAGQGVLFVVATPIGNLEDITLRALRTLREADLILAEDTRRTRVLLDHHAIPARPLSLHAHNEAGRGERVLAELGIGRRVALVSDAGTPLLSDPGERLVASVIEAGHRVVSIPGPTAIAAALSVAGLRTTPFHFEGFLPRGAGDRRRRLEALAARSETLVFFESPRRLARSLAELHEVFGERRACVARELTKHFEEAARGTLSELALRFSGEVRGEITLVVEGAPEAQPAAAAAGGLLSDIGASGLGAPVAPRASPDWQLDAEIRRRLADGQGAREIAAQVARRMELPRRAVYQRVLELAGK